MYHFGKRHEITILNTGESFLCSEKKHLLQGMSSLGKKGIPSGCHGGGCGVCKIKITTGDYSKLVMSRAHVSEVEEKEGIVLACRVFPLSDISLDVVGKLTTNIQRPSAVIK